MSDVKSENYIVDSTVLSNYRDLLSVYDLAEIFGVSKNTIYKSIREGKFGTPISMGRAYRIPKIVVIKKFFTTIND